MYWWVESTRNVSTTINYVKHSIYLKFVLVNSVLREYDDM